jgi:hypothetical protein
MGRRLDPEQVAASRAARNARLAAGAHEAGLASGRARAVVPPAVVAPACMTAAEWVGWRRHNDHAQSNRAPSPCFDCPLGFAADMRAIGMCDGKPDGVPEEDDEMVPASLARRVQWREASRRHRARAQGAA